MFRLKSLIPITMLMLTSFAGESLAFSTGAGDFGSLDPGIVSVKFVETPPPFTVPPPPVELGSPIIVPHVDIGNPTFNWITPERAQVLAQTQGQAKWVTPAPFATSPSALPLETGCGSSPLCAGNAFVGSYTYTFPFDVQLQSDPTNVVFSYFADNEVESIVLFPFDRSVRPIPLSVSPNTMNQLGTATITVSADLFPGLLSPGDSVGVEADVIVKNSSGAGFNPTGLLLVVEQVEVVPEPSTLSLLGIGALSWFLFTRLKRRLRRHGA